jgi:hypothetical protein
MKSNPHRSGRHQTAPAPETLRLACRHGRIGSGASIGKPAAFEPRGANPRGCRMSRRTLALADLKLRQIEDAFLDTLLDAHPRRTTALDRLLEDLAAAGPARAGEVAGAAVPAPDGDVAAASAQRIESTLLAAVIEHHPRRDRALDRLLYDVGVPAGAGTIGAGDAPTPPDAAHGAWVDEDDCRRAADPFYDFDFDGLG